MADKTMKNLNRKIVVKLRLRRALHAKIKAAAAAHGVSQHTEILDRLEKSSEKIP